MLFGGNTHKPNVEKTNDVKSPIRKKITLNNSQEFLGLSESEWHQLIALNHVVLFVMSQLAKKW